MAALAFATPAVTVNRIGTCQHPEFADSVFAERATAPITWATIDQITLHCGDCREDLYPNYNFVTDAVDVLDEPYGAGAE